MYNLTRISLFLCKRKKDYISLV